MRVWSLTFLLISLALAGCLGGDADGTTDSVTDDGSGQADPAGGPDLGGGNGTDPANTGSEEPADPGEGDGGAAQGNATSNTLPTAVLSSDVDGGEAPLTVVFTLNATDPDGDTLAWDLDLDGDGSSDADGVGDLPQTVEHTFETVGDFTVTFTVSDADGSDVANKTIQVIEPVTEETQTVTFEGTVTAPDPFLTLAEFCLSPFATSSLLFFVPGSDVFGQTYNVPAETIGWKFHVEAPTTASFIAGSAPSTSGHDGTVPAGATQVVVCASEPMVDYVLTFSPPA